MATLFHVSPLCACAGCIATDMKATIIASVITRLLVNTRVSNDPEILV
jgi:hypothetical protein